MGRTYGRIYIKGLRMKDYGVTSANVTGTFPLVRAKNSSTGTSTDGTPFVADYLQPTWVLTQSLMDRCGSMANSGTIESYTAVGSGSASGQGYVSGDPAQQLLWSMQRHFGLPGEIVEHFLNSTAQGQDRVLPLTGQVVDGYLYPDLWHNTWVGAGANATAAAFYTTSDAGGTTRATTGFTVNGVTGGRYLVLPDCRGLSPIGLGANTKTTIAYTGGTSIGAYLADKMQGHEHLMRASTSGGTPASIGGATTDSFLGVSASSGRYYASTTGDGSRVMTGYNTEAGNTTPRTGLYTQTPGFACNIGIRY